jgi:hypothetical protein
MLLCILFASVSAGQAQSILFGAGMSTKKSTIFEVGMTYSKIIAKFEIQLPSSNPYDIISTSDTQKALNYQVTIGKIFAEFEQIQFGYGNIIGISSVDFLVKECEEIRRISETRVNYGAELFMIYSINEKFGWYISTNYTDYGKLAGKIGIQFKAGGRE